MPRPTTPVGRARGGARVRRAAAMLMAAAGVAGLAAMLAQPRVSAQSQPAASTGSPGSLADSCGAPATPPQASGRGAQPTFPPGQYPVSLPAVSHLGARNDLAEPVQPGRALGPAAGRPHLGIHGRHRPRHRRHDLGDRSLRRLGRRRRRLRRLDARSDPPVRHHRQAAQELRPRRDGEPAQDQRRSRRRHLGRGQRPGARQGPAGPQVQPQRHAG